MADQFSLFDDGPLMKCPCCLGTGMVSAANRPTDPIEGMVGRDHPDTSQRAARHPSNMIRFGTQRHRTLKALAEARWTGLTAAEVASKIGTSRNQAATRLLECRQVGWVEYSRDADGSRLMRPTGPRDDGLVQEITALGRAILKLTEEDHEEG